MPYIKADAIDISNLSIMISVRKSHNDVMLREPQQDYLWDLMVGERASAKHTWSPWRFSKGSNGIPGKWHSEINFDNTRCHSQLCERTSVICGLGI